MNQIKKIDLIEMVETINNNLSLITCARLALDREDSVIGRRLVETLYIAECNIEDEIEKLQESINELQLEDQDKTDD